MCSKSESITKIAMALVAFSSDVKTISHDSTNPHFKSQYTSLDHMIDVTKPLLHKHGLTVMQFPGGDGEKITVRTMILHESGEWIESEPLTLKAVKTDPQGAGSAITYARRYSYAAALSLSLGDDDDGNGASQPPVKPQSAPKTENAPKPTQTHTPSASAPQASTGGANLISEAQVKYSLRLKNEKKISDSDFKRIISEHSEGNEEIKQLTKRQASEFINLLTAYIIQEDPFADSINISSDELPF